MWWPYHDYTKFTPEALKTNRRLAEERRNKMLADIEAETSVDCYAGYSETPATVILHKLIYVVLWLLSYGCIAYATIKYEMADKASNNIGIGIVTIPMFITFFVFAYYLFSQLRTGTHINYFLYIHGVKQFRIVSVVYAVMTTLTVIALYIILFTSEVTPSSIVLIFIGIGLVSIWLLVGLERLRKITFEK